MRALRWSFAGIIGAILLPQPASAQCNFNEPARASGFKASFVRAYASCPGVTFSMPNTQTAAGVDGCTPPVSLSPYQFDDKNGKCKIKAKQDIEEPCSDGSGTPCANLSFRAQCKGVNKPDGVTPTNRLDGNWFLNTVARATIADEASGDITVTDFPGQFVIPPASKGRFDLRDDTNNLLTSLFGPGAGLPACSALEFVSLKIADPDGELFATMGSSSVQVEGGFDQPDDARGFKSELVRAYMACPSATFALPNTSSEHGVPACSPPVAASPFLFDEDKGRCRFRTKHRLEEPCENGAGVDCANVLVSVRCSGVNESDGATPVSTGTWSVSARTRVTLADLSNGEQTLVDFPVSFSFAEPRGGKLKLSSDTTTLLTATFGPGTQLPPNTSIEILTVTVLDPDDEPFAVLGTSTR